MGPPYSARFSIFQDSSLQGICVSLGGSHSESGDSTLPSHPHAEHKMGGPSCYNPNSLKGGYLRDYTGEQGIKGDTRRLDYSSCGGVVKSQSWCHPSCVPRTTRDQY